MEPHSALLTVLKQPLLAALSKQTFRWRVAFFASRAAKRDGITVSARALRGWLSDPAVQQELKLGRAPNVRNCVAKLGPLVEGLPDGREGTSAERLFGLILTEFQRALSPRDATTMGTALVRNDLEELASAVTTRGLALERIHPWRREDAAEISWPPLQHLLRQLNASNSPSSTLEQWSQQIAEVFEDAPADALTWFASVALDHEASAAAEKFLEAAIVRGAVPENYWAARLGILIARDDDRRSTALDLFARHQPQHPLALAHEAIWNEDWSTARTELGSWAPDSKSDEAIRVALLSALANAEGNLNLAIQIGSRYCEQEDAGAGVLMHTAELLLQRGYHGYSDHRLTDFANAYALAVRARDHRRTWHGDSVAAILVAMKAAALMSDTDTVKLLAVAAPDGEATAAESQDQRLARERAIFAAMSGDAASALAVAENVDDAYAHAYAKGWSALWRDDLAVAFEFWTEAAGLAPTDEARLQVAHTLATNSGPLPDLDDLRTKHASHVRDIELIHQVMTASPGQLSALKSKALTSEHLTVAVAQRLSTESRRQDAAEILVASARRWQHPLLMRMAATYYMQDDLWAKAEEAAADAIALGGASWAGAVDAMKIQFDALEAQGKFDDSLIVARRLASASPSSLGARWVLVECLLRRGDTAEAWAALCGSGEPAQPRSPHEVRCLMALAAEHDESGQFLERALNLMTQWVHDGELLGTILAQTYLGLTHRNMDVPDEELATLHRITSDYEQDHPNSQTFRAIKVDPDNPLASLEELAQPIGAHDDFRELASRVANGELPVGVLATVGGKGYIELLIRGGVGIIFARDPRLNTSASEAFGASVALDATAAVSLARLDVETAELILGQFLKLESTDSLYKDALAAQRDLRLRSTLSLGWTGESDGFALSSIPDEVADRLAREADRVLEILLATDRHSWHTFQSLDDFDPVQASWLAAVDFAVTRSLPLWCDDRIIAAAARDRGVAVFGTVDLIEQLVTSNQLSVEDATVARAALIRAGYVDLEFDHDAIRLAAQLDGWRAGGAAVTLSRPVSWRRPDAVAQLLISALDQHAQTDPQELQLWVSYAATGLSRVSVGGEQEIRNLAVLFGRIVRRPWANADAIRFVVDGIRSGAKAAHADRDATRDAVAYACERIFEEQINSVGPAVALAQILRLIERLDEEDRVAVVTRVLLFGV